MDYTDSAAGFALLHPYLLCHRPPPHLLNLLQKSVEKKNEQDASNAEAKPRNTTGPRCGHAVAVGSLTGSSGSRKYKRSPSKITSVGHNDSTLALPRCCHGSPAFFKPRAEGFVGNAETAWNDRCGTSWVSQWNDMWHETTEGPELSSFSGQTWKPHQVQPWQHNRTGNDRQRQQDRERHLWRCPSRCTSLGVWRWPTTHRWHRCDTVSPQKAFCQETFHRVLETSGGVNDGNRSVHHGASCNAWRSSFFNTNGW